MRNAQHAHVRLPGAVGERGLVEVGGDQHFDELAVENGFCGRAIQPRVEGEDAAEGRGRIGRVRGFVGVGAIRTHGGAARVRMLDDDAGRPLELAHAFPGGVGVGDVVVAQFLALQLGEGRERARHRPQVAVERRLLVRVLAVAQVHHLDEVAVTLAGEQRQRTVVLHGGQVVADEGVVLGDAVERGDRQRETRLRGQRAVVRIEFGQQSRVLRRIGRDRDMGEVLRRRAQHRGAADVDVLDDVVERAVRIHRHPFERIQVQHQQVDRGDAVFGHHRIVLAASTEQPAMHLRVQGLDAAVHDLGEAGQVGNVPDRQAGLADRLGRTARGQQFDAARRERTGEVDQARLVGDGQQRAAHGHGR